jgi:uncharacterized membrane protein
LISALPQRLFAGSKATALQAPRLIVGIALLALGIGIFFRFYHLDQKVYDGDEVYTSLRFLGKFERDSVQRAPSFHTIADVRSLIHPTPSYGSTDPLGPLRALAAEEPQHAPIFYELGHLWVAVFGNSIAAVRALPAALSLLALPLAFWLGVELYDSRSAGWIALALTTLSPVAVALAQDAREYSLWSVATLALALALLRALRCDDLRAWTLVAVLTAVSCYIYTLTPLVILALAVYAAVVYRRSFHLLARCALSFGIGLLAFVPWLWLIVERRVLVEHTLGSVLVGKLSLMDVARSFFSSMKLNVLYFGGMRTSLWGELTTVLAIVAIVAAFVVVIRSYPPRVWLFVVLPMAVCALPFILADLVLPGQWVREVRYYLPCFLFIDVAFAGAFAVLISSRAKLGVALLVALLACRAGSIVISSQAVTWWSTEWDQSLNVVPAIDEAKRPLIVSDNFLLYSIVLANYVRPDITVVLRPPCYDCSLADLPPVRTRDLPSGPFSEVFALGPSSELQPTLQSWARSQHPPDAYTCINVRGNCRSRLNVEPQF